MRIIIKAFYYCLNILAFIASDSGKQCGVSKWNKLLLAIKIFRNSRHKSMKSSFIENMVLAKEILSIPPEDEGFVAEFGCYGGMSSANLSLACKLTNRRLLIFDSFEGLATPEKEVRHIRNGEVVPYQKGDMAIGLDQVRENIEKFGCIEVCELIKGFFCDTLPSRPDDEHFVLIFEDADLPESVEDVLKWGYQKLQLGCKFFTHEALDLEVVGLFFDNIFWNNYFNINAPGLVGGGLGLPLEPYQGWKAEGENNLRIGLNIGSCMGYVVKK